MLKIPVKIIICLAFSLLTLSPIWASDVLNESFGWALNLAETWVVLDYDADNGIISFSDGEGHAIMQVIVREKGQSDDALAVLDSVIDGLGAQADRGTFSYSGHDAALADASWTAGSVPVRGYIVTIDDEPRAEHASNYPYDYILMVFSMGEEYDMYHDFLLSNLDGFSPIQSEYHMPGPVDQFLRSTGGSDVIPFTPGPSVEPPLTSARNAQTPLADLRPSLGSDAGADTAWSVIERESRILQQFAEAPEQTRLMAWRRFYQMLYRDSWYDMRELSTAIDGRLMAQGIIRSEYPSEILTWLQGYSYQRAGGLGDIEPALTCYVNQSGDCDSLALMYIAILDHLGFDSLLMISEVHAHSIVGVDVDGPGARFPYLDKQWLVAELTADVSIGMISSEQSDPADWMGFDLDFHPEW